MEEMKRTAVHTQTAAMLEMGTNLLSQSAEQTRKLTDVETQVSEPGVACLGPIQMNNCAGHGHTKTNDVTRKTTGGLLIKCRSDVIHCEAVPKGEGNRFQQQVVRL